MELKNRIERLEHGQPGGMSLLTESNHTDADITSLYTTDRNGVVATEIMRRPDETFASLQRRAWPHRHPGDNRFTVGYCGKVMVEDRRVEGVTVTIA